MNTRIIQGDVFDTLPTIPRGSVDCVVTSPPYWMLRSYLPKGHALKTRELGSEPTIGEYIANQVGVFRLVRDALADHGTCWLNIGDTYSAGSRVGHGTWINQKQATNIGTLGFDERANPPGLDSGSLCLIPWRLALALQDDGWLVRSVVVWHKPAPMPASLSGWQWRRCRVKVKSRWVEGRDHPSKREVSTHGGDCCARTRGCLQGENQKGKQNVWASNPRSHQRTGRQSKNDIRVQKLVCDEGAML